MPNKIARKLILLLIFFSSVLTLLISAFQLYLEYEHDIGLVQSYFRQIDLSYRKSIAENIWEEDRDRLELLITGIAEYPGFKFVQVKDTNGLVLARIGDMLSHQFISHSYPLTYSFRGTELEIGTLDVAADLTGIYQRLFERVGIILLSNAIKTIIIALFLFSIIRWLITNQLDMMIQFARKMNLSPLMQPLQLDRGSFSGKHDEVDQLAESLNEMQRTLSQAHHSLKESEQRFRQLAENINEVFWLSSPDMKELFYLSPAFEKNWGRKIEDLYAHPEAWIDSIHPDDKAQVLSEIPKNPDSIKTHIDFSEYRILHPDGKICWVKARAYPIRDENGHILRIAGIAEDITERRLVDEQLRKLSLAIESSSSAVFMTTDKSIIEYVNQKFIDLTGYTREEVIGKNPDFLFVDEARDASITGILNTIKHSDEWKGELDFQSKDSRRYRARMSISTVKDSKEKITHFIGFFDDVSHEYKLAEQLNFQASHDALTGLYNRVEFERQAERLFTSSRESDIEHALCFMDLDQFKVINDTCGHIAGDQLLRQLSHILQESVRQSDTLARLGGDEFGVLMQKCSLEQAHRLAESIQKSIQEFRFGWEDQYFQVGISIGLVAITRATGSLTDLLKQADAACYMAKDLGRNRIHEYHPEDNDMVQRQGEMLWVNRINQALEHDRLRLYAQPIVPLGDKEGKHYELLIRMLDEKGAVIPPGSFLPAAERYDLIEKVDSWVVHKAFDLLSTHPAFVEKIDFVSINLSGASLTSGAFLDYIFSKFNQTHLNTEKICFEVTETVAISNLTAAITFIDLLKQTGCRFALDDFGSGLSSFGYLKSLPVDYLKIDGMFVKDIADDPIDYAMVKSINDIGHVMEMQTIAEFVENDEIKEKLIEIGVDFAQGYGIGKPQSFEELVKG